MHVTLMLHTNGYEYPRGKNNYLPRNTTKSRTHQLVVFMSVPMKEANLQDSTTKVTPFCRISKNFQFKQVAEF